MPPIEDGQSLDELATGLFAPEKSGQAKPAVVEKEEPEADEAENEHTDSESGEDNGEAGNAEDATGAEGEPEEGAEDREEAEAEEPSTEPLYTVTIDGKAEQVTLKEALAGFQRNADYTRKTQQVAEERKILDATHAEARAQRDQYGQLLKVIQERLGAVESERTEEQWAQLRQSDPAAYAAEYADMQRRQEARKAVKAEQDRIEGTQRQETLFRLSEVVKGEREKLVAALPVLKDPKKGPAELKAIRDFAAETYGFSEDELNRVYDHRLLLMVNEARQWRGHQAALAKARTKVAEAPELPEPGSRQPQKGRKDTARVAQEKRFERSGRVEDAADLLIVKR
jgi:hypothetical protein